jgi:hypothetical protein
MRAVRRILVGGSGGILSVRLPPPVIQAGGIAMAGVLICGARTAVSVGSARVCRLIFKLGHNYKYGPFLKMVHFLGVCKNSPLFLKPRKE